MTNILYWNIRQFSIDLVKGRNAVVLDGTGGLTEAVAAEERLQIILDVINATRADIVSIVEPQTGSNGGCDLATNSGGLKAAGRLLNRLRAADAAAQWRMAPPLWLGSRDFPPNGTETVVVLYRGVTGNVTRYFTGPNVWTGGAGGESKDPTTGVFAPSAYPKNYNKFIDNPTGAPPVPARVIPAAAAGQPAPPSLYRAGQPENQSAARIYYPSPPAPPPPRTQPARGVKRPRQDNDGRYGEFRPPYMTSFYEVDATTNIGRNLTVFSIHTKPSGAVPETFVAWMSQTPEITAAPAASETKVICGDFNLQFLDALGVYTNVYARLTTAPLSYQSLLPINIAPPADPNQLQAFRGYFATHLSDQPKLLSPINPADVAATRFLWSDGATDSYYPGYGYTSAAQNTDSIDNILVWPRPVGCPLTIMNLVTGSPFVASDALIPPAVVPAIAVPLGDNLAILPLATQFTAVPAGAVPPGAAWPVNPTARDFYNGGVAAGMGDATALWSWPNYGRIYSTSDHLPMVTTL